MAREWGKGGEPWGGGADEPGLPLRTFLLYARTFTRPSSPSAGGGVGFLSSFDPRRDRDRINMPAMASGYGTVWWCEKFRTKQCG